MRILQFLYISKCTQQVYFCFFDASSLTLTAMSPVHCVSEDGPATKRESGDDRMMGANVQDNFAAVCCTG